MSSEDFDSGVEWIEALLRWRWTNVAVVLLGGLIGVMLKHSGDLNVKLGALSALLGTTMLLMAQEGESAQLRREISITAAQLEALIDRRSVDQRNRGTVTRLAARKPKRFLSAWKSAGLVLLVFGTTYVVL